MLRYEYDIEYDIMRQSPAGSWVKYSDAKKLLDELNRLKDVLNDAGIDVEELL